jgi:sulfofructose kinase
VDGISRVPGAATSISGIFVDAAGERLLCTRRSHGLTEAKPQDPARLLRGAGAMLADNHFAAFVIPVCEAARACGLAVVLDIDRATQMTDPLLALATHPVFSAEALRGTTGMDELEPALARAAEVCGGFVAVTDGANGALWRGPDGLGRQAAFRVAVVDTLAAGDVFHAAFALALAEGRSEEQGLRFASAAAALKCTRFGGIVGSPRRSEVEALLMSDVASP